ncbi:U3 small nucleolar RNA-associated protein, partial [Coemansia sp. RSA 486]
RLHKEDSRLLEQQQALDNFLVAKDYRNAIMLTLSLDQPHRLLNIFQDVISAAERRDGLDAETELDSDGRDAEQAIVGARVVDDVIGSLAPDQLERLLGYVRNWNTNAKFARVAQAVLYCVLTKYTSQTILDLPSAKDLISAIQPYSERHFSRFDSLLTDSFIVDYTLHAMESFHPVGMETLTINADDDDDDDDE